MVLLKKSFHLLGYEQVTPTITLSSGNVTSSRRSDTFWVMHHKQMLGVKAVARRHLSFLHNNMHDVVPNSEKIRESVALEMIGAIICRSSEKKAFASQRVFALRSSIARIQGICKVLRERPYFSQICDLESFVDFLEELFNNDKWQSEVFEVVDKHVTKFETWNINDEPRRTLEYNLDREDRSFLIPCYPDVTALNKGPLLPIPCLHRIHQTVQLSGAQNVQERIGMSLLLSEVENRLRNLSRLVHVVRASVGNQRGATPSPKALVTIDDGFKDVLLLLPIFKELSHTLQPVLCIPSAILRDKDKGMTRRHLPLTCLYQYCFESAVDPNDDSVLGDAARPALKLIPEKEQYHRLSEAGIPIDIPTDDLLTIDDIKAVTESGWWLCSHGPDHSDLSMATSIDGVLQELQKDMNTLRQHKWAPWFAWPEGRWCSRTSNQVARLLNGPVIQFGLSIPDGEVQHPAVLSRSAWLGDGRRPRVLITGSGGFLGRHLRLVLLGYGYDVFEYDIIDGMDILDKGKLLGELKNNCITSCVHLAAIADLNEVEKNPAESERVNIDGTRNVLSCCDDAGVRLLFASTCCVYGNNNIHGSSNEDSPVNPTELYAKTKLKSEQEVLKSCRKMELHHVVLRLATFYGPGMRPALATARFLDAVAKSESIQIHGDGTQTRCFTHVHDIAEGIRVILQTTDFDGIINVADDRECSVNELAKIAVNVSEKELQIFHVEDRCGQIQQSKIDNTRLRKLGNLGWKPTITLEDGMLGCAISTRSKLLEDVQPRACAFPERNTSNLHDAAREVAARCKLEETTLPIRHRRCNGVLYVTEELPDGTQLVAYAVGNVKNSAELHVRIHSECLTGDVLGSLKCDCGPQKQSFLDFISNDRPGIFLYVKGHEGRAAGLLPKIRAYHDIDNNPTKHHNIALLNAGAKKVDSRCFDASAEMILRVASCTYNLQRKTILHLHSNNKSKVEAVKRAINSCEKRKSRFICLQYTIPAGENCNIYNHKYLREKENDNGQCGLLSLSKTLNEKLAFTPECTSIPENIDALHGVDTKVNQAKFNSTDEGLFDFFKENGYVVVRSMVSKDQIAKAKQGYEVIQQKLFDGIRQNVGHENVTLEDCSKTISQFRDLFLRGDECSVFKELTYDDAPTSIASIATQAMQTIDPKGQWQGLKLLHDHIITKTAGRHVSKSIPLHQDRMFWPVDIPGCSAWIPLEDVPLHGGCLELVTTASKPHLHNQNVHAVDFMADERNNGLKLLLQDDPNPVRWLVPMEAGDTLIFSSHVWHRSSPNDQPAVNRMAYIQTWVHPLAKWRPDVVPWHPVNEHLVREGYDANDVLAGRRHPTVNVSHSVGFEASCYSRTECVVNNAIKGLDSQISMFDAVDVISTQIRNIFSLCIETSAQERFPSKQIKAQSIMDMVKNESNRAALVKSTLEILHPFPLASLASRLPKLCEESACTTESELLVWCLKEIMISAAAYGCDRSRNVFNSAYSAWWTVAGEAWNTYFLSRPFTPDYFLCKTDVDRFLNRIRVQRDNRQRDMLNLLSSIIQGCMEHIPFQNFNMLTRVDPKTQDRHPPTLGEIINDMLTGQGGLCSTRNPFLYLLLRALDFDDVRFVSGTMCLSNGDELVDAHVALLVSIEGQDYWVDIANGWPYVEPICLNFVLVSDHSAIINHPALRTRLVSKNKNGKRVLCVQHLPKTLLEWTDNYYFERVPVNYDCVFGASMRRHYDYREHYGPFLHHLRFNMWSSEKGIVLRDDTLVLYSPDGSLKTREDENWDGEKFNQILSTTNFVVENSITQLISQAWNICQKNAIYFEEILTVTGGFFDNTADGYIGMLRVCRRRADRLVQKLTFEKVRVYSPEIHPVINKGFAGGTWHNDELYVCWPNRVSVVSPLSKWEIRSHIDNECFNDLHHVHACNHGIWVANTGCDTIDEVSASGLTVRRYPLSHAAEVNVDEDIRGQLAHTVRRGRHNEHVNYVSPLECSGESAHDMTVTLLQSKRVVTLAHMQMQDVADSVPTLRMSLPSTSPPHEGFVATVPSVCDTPLLWNSTVDGHVIASNPRTTEIFKIWKISDYKHLPRGWTRGLLLLEDGFLVGCTVIHGDAESWIARHGNNWDFNIAESQTAISFIPYDTPNVCDAKSVSFLTNRKEKIFSILHTPPSALSEREQVNQRRSELP